MRDTHQLESRMREIRPSGSAGGAEQTNAPSLPLSNHPVPTDTGALRGKLATYESSHAHRHGAKSNGHRT